MPGLEVIGWVAQPLRTQPISRPEEYFVEQAIMALGSRGRDMIDD